MFLFANCLLCVFTTVMPLSARDRKCMDMLNVGGASALHLAVRNGHTNMVTLLVDQGCLMNLEDEDGITRASALESLFNPSSNSFTISYTCLNLIQHHYPYDKL